MRPSRRARAAKSSSSLSESVNALPRASTRYSDGRISRSPALITSPVCIALQAAPGDARGGYGVVNRLFTSCERRGAVASLFEHGIDPMIVIRWKDIFESLEAAVDACETVANVLEGISLKR